MSTATICSAPEQTVAVTLDAALREVTRRPLAVYTAECLTMPSFVKTAIGVLRFAPERVRAVVDERNHGVALDEVPGWRGFPPVRYP